MPITRRQFLKGAVAALPAISNQELFAEEQLTLDDLVGTWNSEILDYLSINNNNFVRSGTNYQLPPELVAAVLYNEKNEKKTLSRIIDNLLSRTMLDPSIGDGQIKISSAITADGKDPYKLSPREHWEYRQKLLETPSNIDYVAKYLRFLLNRQNRFPKISAEELLNNPRAMAIAATEYNRGPTSSLNEEAMPNAYGLQVVSLLTSPIISTILGRELPEGGKRIKQYIEENKGLLTRAKVQHDGESDMKFSNRSAYYMLALTGIGVLYYLLHRYNAHTSRKKVV